MENNQENKNIVIDNELQSKEASKDEAYSKNTHKICTHISQSAKEVLDAILFYEEGNNNGLDSIPKIVSEALSRIDSYYIARKEEHCRLSERLYKSRDPLKPIEKTVCKITISLDQSAFMDLLEIAEVHLGDGRWITNSTIIDVAILDFGDAYFG